MLRLTYLLVFVIISFSSAYGQLTLEKDINDEGASSFPSYVTAINDYLYLAATDVPHGDELWRVNIATGEYDLLADINEGEGSSNPAFFEVIDGKLYFLAEPSRSDYVLMTYDPESEILDKVQPEGLSEMSVNNRFVQVGNVLVFQTEVSRNKNELGIYDINTNILEVIDVGASGNSRPSSFAVVDSKVWFVAVNDNGDRTIWTYDSTTKTVTEESIANSEGIGLTTFEPVVLDGKIYHAGFTQDEGTELYAIDIANKNLISYDPIFNGRSSGSPSNFTIYNDQVYFTARPGGLANRMYVINDALNEYESISELFPDNIQTISGLQVYTDRLYFTGLLDDEITRPLYSYNAVSGDVDSYSIADSDEYQNQLALQLILDDQAYVNLFDPLIGQEFYKFDLNTEELSFIADFNPATIGSSPFDFTAFNGKLYFGAQPAFERRTLFEYDPSDGSIGRVSQDRSGESATNLVELDGKLYFAGISSEEIYGIQYYDPNSDEILSTSYQTPTVFGGIQELVVYNNKLFFDGDNDEEGAELFFYDPSTGESGVAADIDPDGDSRAEDYFVFNNELFFTASTPEFGNELWKYNDFTREVTRLTDIAPGSDGSNIFPIIEYNNKLFFVPRSGDNAGQWHSYDPIAEEIILETNEQSTLNVDWAVVYNDELYFSGRLSSRISGELLAFDDNADTLRLVADLNGTRASNPRYLTVFNNKLYFQATTDDFGSELFEHLGGEGATIVTDINPGSLDSDPKELTVFNDKLYFQATDGLRGEEIWSLAACLNVVVESTTPEIDEEPTGSVDITVTGGTEPYEFLWSNGAEIEDLDNLLAGEYELTVKDQSGCLSTIKVTITKETTTSNDELASSSIAIFPNPVHDILYFTVKQTTTETDLRILNTQGQTVLPGVNTSERSILVSSLQSGIYYLVYTSGESQHIVKFVKHD